MGKKILIILGAGSSYPSGIKTFRGSTGMGMLDYYQYFTSYWWKNKGIYNQGIDFFKKLKKDWLSKEINYYHVFLKELEKINETYIISQNIDNLDSNLQNVLKIHGDLSKSRCSNNYKHFIDNKDIGDICDKCGAKLIPDIVYYEETYSKNSLNKINHIKKIDFDYIILIGTTLEITFMQNLILYFINKNILIININPEKEFKGVFNFKTLDDFKKSNLYI